jgi:hypothetical protein
VDTLPLEGLTGAVVFGGSGFFLGINNIYSPLLKSVH